MGRSWADLNDIQGFLYFNQQIKNNKVKKSKNNYLKNSKKTQKQNKKLFKKLKTNYKQKNKLITFI